MKLLQECLIDGQEVEISHCHIVLELNAAGRGFLVVASEQPHLNKTVELSLGTHDNFYRYFHGTVEEVQEEQPGFQKLFIRETAAKFEQALPCSIRHATLNDVLAYASQQTGIAIKVAAGTYASTPIPNFTHSGSGFQLLNNLGRLFSIPDYMWQQSADGSLFVGSHQDSQWQKAPFEIDEQEALRRGNNQLTLPADYAIRPGAILNGNKIEKTELFDDELTVHWVERNQHGKPKSKTPEQRMLDKHHPELAGGYHLPRYARVLGVADPSAGGDIVDPFRPKYAVELQLLDEHGNDDTSTPPYSAVPLPVTSTGSQGGDFAFPEVGTIVEIGYAYGRPDQPFVRTMLAQNKTVPAVAIGEQLKQQRPEVFERTDAAGNKTRETDQTITDRSYQRIIETDNECKTIGTSRSDIDADKHVNVGGNHHTAVVGNIHTTTASNYVNGVGGEMQERIQGVAQRVSDVKNKMVAPQSYVGSEGQNIFRILEDVIQILADLAATTASHTHNGGPAPDQKDTFKAYNASATGAKGKLSPIIE